MRLLKDGKKVIASNLCGLHIPINGMYVTYGPASAAWTSPPEADYNFFKTLGKLDGTGYARVAITSSQLKDDGKIIYTAMITTDDLVGAPIADDSVLTTATLVHLDEYDKSKDLFVYSAVLKNKIKILSGAYMVVNVGISVGE